MHQARPPVIDEILTLLERYGVRYVLRRIQRELAESPADGPDRSAGLS
jgi:hypothetical protein